MADQSGQFVAYHHGSRRPRQRTHPAVRRSRSKKFKITMASLGISALTLVLVPIFVAVTSSEANRRLTPTPTSRPPTKSPSPSNQWVIVDKVEYVRNPSDNDTFVFAADPKLTPQQLSHAPSITTQPDTAIRWAWWRKIGGVDPGKTEAKVFVRGGLTRPVRITDIRPVSTCQRPLTGALAYSPSGGEETITPIVFDLDRPSDGGRELKRDGQLAGPYFEGHTVRLEPEEEFTFHLIAKTSKQYCEFTYAMDILYGGQESTVKITDQGRPFRVSAMHDQALMSGGSFDDPRFPQFQALYIGGTANPPGRWGVADPSTYRGG